MGIFTILWHFRDNNSFVSYLVAGPNSVFEQFLWALIVISFCQSAMVLLIPKLKTIRESV